MSKRDKRLLSYFDKYTFTCEMYDYQANKIRELVLNFFPYDDSVQVIDLDRNKVLLRRSVEPELCLEKLQVGNTIALFGKLLLITGCPLHTEKLLFRNFKSTFALIKPMEPVKHGKVITFIVQNGFHIVRMKNAKIEKSIAMDIYKDISGNRMLPLIIDYIISGEVIGLELRGEDAVNRWRKCLGATDPQFASPGTVRHLLGEDILRNAAHGSDTEESAQFNLERFFGYTNGFPNVPFRATFKDCSCCVVKPHVLIDGSLGPILEHIARSKFYIAAMAMFSVKYSNALEFYELYKGVLPEYEMMAAQLAEGKCIALEIKLIDPKPDENVVCEFRKLCGPREPDMARQLYPDSLRALYGKTIIKNAVHCTDLPEEGELEVEYFFKLVANDL